MKTLTHSVVLAGLVALVSGLAAAQAIPVSEANPLQLASDPFMGDWQGKTDSGSALCAQVIAWKDGEYQANMLSAFDERKPALAVLRGKVSDGALTLEGGGWTATIQGEAFKGNGKDGAFTLAKAERLSPSLGTKPPQGAIILFDGTNTDEWIHPVSNPWLVNLKEEVGGDQRVAYIKAEVWSPDDREAELQLGTDDGVKVWVNNEEVLAKNVSRGVKPGEDKIKVKLHEKWNAIMLKVIQGTGDWGACVRLRAANGAAMEDVNVADQTKPMGDPGTPLKDTDGWIMDWRVSGPYSEEGKEAPALFDVAFEPEKGATKDWRVLPKRQLEEFVPCPWRLLDNGVMEVKGGGVVTKAKFHDHHLHIEFRTPFMADKDGQGRGNSGVYVQGRYEVQVLDSYGLEGKDNECGGIYKVSGPRVNMCAPPLQWQTYDITFHETKFDPSGNKVKDAVITVIHNGVPIHQDLILPHPTPGGVNYDLTKPGGLYLQDHGNPVWFRNVWAVPLDNGQG